MKTLSMFAVVVLLIATSHKAMAQCSGSVYVAPTSTDCSCGGLLGYTCDEGGDQINGYNKCGTIDKGGTKCISTDGVIGTTKTCTSHYSALGAIACAGTATGCIYFAIIQDWHSYEVCVHLAEHNCDFCEYVLTCTEADNDIHGQVFDSTTGQCPNNG